MLKHKKLITRVFMLAVLTVGLSFVLLSPATQVAYAYPCCYSCPGQDPVDMEPCSQECAPDDYACLNSCYQAQQQCWQTCRSCGGGGGGGFECGYGIDCDPGWTCSNGYCVY